MQDTQAAAPSEELIDAIMRYGSDSALAGMARIAAIMQSPAVAAIVARVGTLTEDERAKLADTWRVHYGRHRSEQTQLHHKVAKVCEHWRDFGMAGDRAWGIANRPDPDPHYSAAHTIGDIVWATAARPYLTDDEYHLYARPWFDVIGESADMVRRALVWEDTADELVHAQASSSRVADGCTDAYYQLRSTAMFPGERILARNQFRDGEEVYVAGKTLGRFPSEETAKAAAWNYEDFGDTN